ncbi:hypothetical protein P7C73_g474, partial [Tremellales sp. Uapishka_1]
MEPEKLADLLDAALPMGLSPFITIRQFCRRKDREEAIRSQQSQRSPQTDIISSPIHTPIAAMSRILTQDPIQPQPISPTYSEDPSLPTPPPETLLPAKQATVYIPAPIHPQGLAYARTRFGRVITKDEVDPSEAWALADGVVNRANPLSKAILQVAPRLSAISQVGVGYDSIDIDHCRDHHIVVTNCPGANGDSVAELTLALTLALLRRISELERRLRAGETMLSINNLGRSLKGKIVGMIGMGSTARKAAELFHHAFACEIHIYSPTSSPSKWTTHDLESGALPHTRHANLVDMLPLVDILTLHCPLTPQTEDLISHPELGLMKADAILVNMSRGAVVNEKALYAALVAGNILGAASDVFHFEPVNKDACENLLELENFVGTPHIGGSTVEAQIDINYLAIDQLADVFDGRQVKNRVC